MKLRTFALFHSVFYILTGVWPLIDIETFMMVTGPKEDLWLVRTVGLLITATGITLFLAARRNEINSSIAWLAILNALFLAGVDIFYTSLHVIPRVYLLDAAVEIVIAGIWIYFLRKKAL